MNVSLEKDIDIDQAAVEMGYGCYNISVGNENCGVPKDKIEYIKNLFSIMFGYRNIGESDSEAEIKKRIDDKMKELGYICYNLGIEGKLPSKSLLKSFAKMRELSETAFTSSENEGTVEDYSTNEEHFSPENLDEPFKFADAADAADAVDDVDGDFHWEPIPIDGIRCVCGYVNDKTWNYCKKCGTKLK